MQKKNKKDKNIYNYKLFRYNKNIVKNAGKLKWEVN